MLCDGFPIHKYAPLPFTFMVQVVTEARELYREQGAVQILQKFRSNTNGAVSCLALILQAGHTFSVFY